MDTRTLKKHLYQALDSYTGKGINATSHLTVNSNETVFTVLAIGEFDGEQIINLGIVVQMIGNFLLIEHDINDKPLVDALIQAGVPRKQIVLAYQGEKLPENAPAHS